MAFHVAAAHVPWRPDVFYAGGVDPVVLAKAALNLCALALAVLLVRVRGRRGPGPAATAAC